MAAEGTSISRPLVFWREDYNIGRTKWICTL